VITQPETFPPHLRAFVDEATWTFAKTMPRWPHEYIVRERVDEQLFVELVRRHIRAHGYQAGSTQRSSSTTRRPASFTGPWAPPLTKRRSSVGASDDTCERRSAAGTLP
jgi:hypothetical protein